MCSPKWQAAWSYMGHASPQNDSQANSINGSNGIYGNGTDLRAGRGTAHAATISNSGKAFSTGIAAGARKKAVRSWDFDFKEAGLHESTVHLYCLTSLHRCLEGVMSFEAGW